MYSDLGSSVEMSRHFLCLEYQKARFTWLALQRRGYYEMIQEGLAGSGKVYEISMLRATSISLAASESFHKLLTIV